MNGFLCMILVSLALVEAQVSLQDLINQEWQTFKNTYNKTYASVEVEQFRREIFIANRAKVSQFNSEFSQGRRTFVQQLNPYGDMLYNEFNRILNGFNRSSPTNANRSPTRIPSASYHIPSANVVYPDHIDWRELGAVTSVKNQGVCASCWAFAATGSLEGQHYRKTGRLVELSAQNLIDCTRSFDNDGCEGGLVEPAFEYVRTNPGIDTEAAYPYEAKDGQCRFRPDGVGAICTGYVEIAEGDEKGLEVAVATRGPVAVAIHAKESLQFYSDGVYFDPDCKNGKDDMNHAVLVVGYGVEANGQKYWLIKNTYGTQWGTGGYMKIARDQDNHCGIATQASYPLV